MTPTSSVSSWLNRAFGEHAERALQSPMFAFLFISSLLLSLASFYTTFVGMLDFMPLWVIAFFITFGIQVLLIATAWALGFMFVGREPGAWTVVGIFVICFCTSVFFSFSSLFNYIFDPGQQERTRMTRVHNAVEVTITDLELALGERRKDLVKELIATDSYSEWRKNVLAVAQVGVESKDRLREIFARRYEELSQAATEADREAQRLVAKKGTIDQDIIDAKLTLDSLAGEREPLQAQIAKLRERLFEAEQVVIKKEAEMEAEAKGGDPGSNRPRGKGPVWLKLRNQRNILAAQRDGIQKQLQSVQGRLKNIDARINELRAKLNEDQALRGTIDGEIKTAEEATRRAQKTLETSGVDVDFNPDDSVRDLRKMLDDFSKTFNLEPFDKAANLCSSLLGEMRKIPDLQSNLRDLSCDRGDMTALIKPIGDAAQALVDLRRDCVSGGDNAKVVTDLSFDDSLKYARMCMSISGLPSNEVQDYRDEIDRLEREESEAASPFTKVSNAILSGEKLAIFSLIIALVIDLLVLFTGLIGAKSMRSKIDEYVNNPGKIGDASFLDHIAVNLASDPDDPPLIRLIKLIVKNASATSHEASGRRYSAKIDLRRIPDPRIREELHHALVVFAGQEYAKLDKSAPDTFYFRSGFLDALRSQLRDHEKTLSYRNEKPAGPSVGLGATTAGEGFEAWSSSAFDEDDGYKTAPQHVRPSWDDFQGDGFAEDDTTGVSGGPAPKPSYASAWGTVDATDHTDTPRSGQEKPIDSAQIAESAEDEKGPAKLEENKEDEDDYAYLKDFMETMRSTKD